MGHRYYNFTNGRFLTRDPIGYQGGLNLYGFVGNNPVNESDPDGTDPPDPDQCGLPNDGDLGMRTAHPGMHAGTAQSNAAKSMTKGLCQIVRDAVIGAAVGAFSMIGDGAIAGSAAARSRVIRVRHYTDPEGLAGIKADGAINPMVRGGTPGVHVEVGPNFGPLSTAQRETGAAIRAGKPTKYVEFNAPPGK